MQLVINSKKKGKSGKPSYFGEFLKSAARFGCIQDPIDEIYPHMSQFIREINSDEEFQPKPYKGIMPSPFRSHPAENLIRSWMPPQDSLATRDYLDIIQPQSSDIPIVIWIQTKEALNALIKKMGQHRIIYCDIEGPNIYSYRGITAVIQISVGENEVFIIDALKLFNDLHVLNEIFTCEHILKIFFAAANDVRNLMKDFSVYIVRLIDLQILANLTSSTTKLLFSCSLVDAVKEATGLELSKHYRNSDYRLRPLPKELEEYAAFDVYVLPSLFKFLLEQPGETFFERLCKAAHKSKEVALQTYKTEENKCSIVTSVSSREEIGLFMRDLICKREDVAPEFLVPGYLIKEIVNTKFQTMESFVERFSKPGARLNMYLPVFALLHTQSDKDVVINLAKLMLRPLLPSNLDSSKMHSETSRCISSTKAAEDCHRTEKNVIPTPPTMPPQIASFSFPSGLTESFSVQIQAASEKITWKHRIPRPPAMPKEVVPFLFPPGTNELFCLKCNSRFHLRKDCKISVGLAKLIKRNYFSVHPEKKQREQKRQNAVKMSTLEGRRKKYIRNGRTLHRRAQEKLLAAAGPYVEENWEAELNAEAALEEEMWDNENDFRQQYFD